MSDFEQRPPEQRQLAAHAGESAALAGSASAHESGNFQTFPQKRLAMQQLLRLIANERAREGAYTNPWAGWSEDQLETYTNRVIDRLQQIRMQDLQVAYAICLEMEAGNKRPQDRLHDLEIALQGARERGAQLKGAVRTRNKAYQAQLERDIGIHKKLYENRASLGGDGQVGLSNISTLLLDTREKPGYVRVYMTVFAPSQDDTHKDLHKDAAGRIVGRADTLWLNFGSPARALSYVNAYRLQMSAGAMPLIRSMLVPMSFLEKHFPDAITEKEKDAIDKWARTNREWRVNPRQEKLKVTQQQPLMNTDTKFANQVGLQASTKRLTLSKQGQGRGDGWAAGRTPAAAWWERAIAPQDLQDMAQAGKKPAGADLRHDFQIVTSTVNPIYSELLSVADPTSFTTYADPSEFLDRHENNVDGTMASFHSLAASVGLAASGEPFNIHLLRGGEHAATLFSIKKGKAWKSPSSDELRQVVQDASDLFDSLDRLPDDGAIDSHTREHVLRPLGDLLEANRLTPGGLLSPSGGLESRQRDRVGNAVVKAAFEEAFADEYLKSDIWRGDMAKWSGSLASAIRRELDEPALEKLYANPYVQQDMQALTRAAQRVQPSNPVEALEEISQSRMTDSPARERQVDLFFHLLRALGERKRTLKADTLNGEPSGELFKVNNRIEETAPFDVINPPPGRQAGPADPLRSTNRFKPNAGMKETAIMRDLDVPFIGGVSGTSRDYNTMMNAVLGRLSPDEFWRFQLLNAAFMIKHGYHSMFEALYPATFYERTRGDVIQKDYDALRRERLGIDGADFYRNALTVALGKRGEELWMAAQEAARRATTAQAQ